MAALNNRVDQSSVDLFSRIRDQGFFPEPVPAGTGMSGSYFRCNYYNPGIPDHEPKTSIQAGVKPRKEPAGFKRIACQIDNLVTDVSSGMINVAARTAIYDYEVEKAIPSLNLQVQNTVCFILSTDGYEKRMVKSQPVYSDKTSSCPNLLTHYEIFDSAPVPASHIVAVLAPFHLVRAVEQVFRGTIEVIPVPDKKTTLNTTILDPKDLIVFVSPKVSFITPDYLSALVELVDKRPQLLQKGFLTHIMQVPPHTLPKKGAGQKKFAIRFDASEVEKVRAIQERYLVAKNSAAKELNEFHVICDGDEQVKEIHSIVSSNKKVDTPDEKKSGG